MNFSVALWFVKLQRAVVYLGVCWCNGIVCANSWGSIEVLHGVVITHFIQLGT